MLNNDLFGDTVVRSPSRTLLRRFLTVFSILGHAVVISAVVVAQLFAIGPLPTPRRPLTFEEARMIKLADIEPPRARTPATAPTATASPDAAPTEMPQSITKETGIENPARRAARRCRDRGEGRRRPRRDRQRRARVAPRRLLPRLQPHSNPSAGI